jgi:hypothetical protein
MTCHLSAVCFDGHRPMRLARFWAGVLGWEMADSQKGIALVPDDDTGFWIPVPANPAAEDPPT